MMRRGRRLNTSTAVLAMSLTKLVSRLLVIRLLGVKGRSGNWGHASRPGLRGGSAPKASTQPKPALSKQSQPKSDSSKQAKSVSKPSKPVSAKTKEEKEVLGEKELMDYLTSESSEISRFRAVFRYVEANSYKKPHIVEEANVKFTLPDAVDFGGIVWHYDKAQTATSLCDSMAEWAKAKALLPDWLGSMVRDVAVHNEPNPGDKYLAKTFNRPGFQSIASADIHNKQINVWQGLSLHVRQYVHELGHLARVGSTIKELNEWHDIVAKGDEAPPTDYARSNEAEDFCESLRTVFNPDEQTRPVPKREAFIRKFLKRRQRAAGAKGK